MMLVVGILAAYCLGSLPTAYLTGRVLKGIDIREHGSGNVGATNTFRVLGRGPGILVLVVDILKGVLGVLGVGALLGLPEELDRILLGLAAVSGHNWTIFLEFKGGKGMATSLGVLIGLAVSFPDLWLVVGMCLFVWILVFGASGYVSLASLLAAVALPVVMVAAGQGYAMVVLAAVFCLFVVVRHRSNLQRILSRTEHRVRWLPWFRT